jgi:hypothetical protein
MQMWFDRCDKPEDVEYVLVVHESNWKDFQSGRYLPVCFPAWANVQMVLNRGANTGCAQGNAGTWRATGEIIAGNNDDLFPPRHWDTMIREAIPDTSREVVLHVSSGAPADDRLFIPQIYTRVRAVRLGYGGHPDYESMFADNEFTEHARMDNVVREARYIHFEHRHPVLGKAKMDAVYEQENRRESYEKGQAVFLRRAAAGFPPLPGHASAPVSAVPVEVSAGPRGIACAFLGQTFDSAYVDAREKLLFHLLVMRQVNGIGEGFRISRHGGHCTNVYTVRMQATEEILQTNPAPDLVLWMDDDNVLEVDQFEMLLADLERQPELDGVVAWCWIYNNQTQRWYISCGDWIGTPDDPYLSQSLDPVELVKHPGVREIGWSGFPVVLMRRSALEKNGGPRGFTAVVDERVKFGQMSEDASWFWRAKQNGLKCAVDTRVKVAHLKKWAIEPPLLQPGAEVPESLKQVQSAAFVG